MPSQIDPTKPLDGVPAVKPDLRNNLSAAQTEININLSGWMRGEERNATHSYTAADLEEPIVILATPAAAMTLTFPNPDDFLPVPQMPGGSLPAVMRPIARIVGRNASNPVTIACAAPASLRSQPGTSGWDEETSPVFLGASLALQDECIVDLYVELGLRTPNLLHVVGAVRASA